MEPACRGRLTRPWGETSARQETDKFGNMIYTDFPNSDRQVAEKVGEIAEARGVPRAQVALAWVIQKQGITAPIVGASKPHWTSPRGVEG